MNPSTMLSHKRIYTLAILLCAAASTQAQVTPSTKKPEPIGPAVRPITTTDKVMDIREKIVQLALQNPNYEIADRRVAIAEYQVKKAKGSWLGVIAVQGNLNELSLKGSTTDPVTGITSNPSSFFPRYNIGANIPFDVFSTKKNDVKIAKENVSIAQAEKNQRFREIKAQVLTKYEDYLLCQIRLDGQSQVTQDARTAYLSAEKDFQEGAIKQEEYNKSYRGYTDEKIKQAEYLRNYNVIKLELESMIGISMDDLLKK